MRLGVYYLSHNSPLEIGPKSPTREIIPTDLQVSPLIGNFPLYQMVTLYLFGKKSYSAFFKIFHYLKKNLKKVPSNLSENRQTS